MKATFLLILLFAVPMCIYAQDSTGAGMYLYYPDARLYFGNTGVIPNQNQAALHLYRNDALVAGASFYYSGLAGASLEAGVYGRTDLFRAQIQSKAFQSRRVFLAASVSAERLVYNRERIDAVISPLPIDGYPVPNTSKSDSTEYTYGLRLESSALVMDELLLSAGAGALLQNMNSSDFSAEFRAGLLFRPYSSIQLKLEYAGYSREQYSMRNRGYAGITLLSFFASVDMGYVFISDVDGMELKQGFVFAAAVYF